MEYNSYLQKCSDNAVLSIDNDLVKLGSLKRALNSVFENNPVILAQYETLKNHQLKFSFQPAYWYGSGKDAELLNPGSQGWKKGKIKIRITLEFCPDEPEGEETPATHQPETSEPESPLDEIRRMMTEDNT